jgi:hypothetical protein
MSTIVLRSAKGSPLTNAEVDANFTNLNNDKTQLGGTYSSGTANGVLFLSPSKVLTTGSALTFDGNELYIAGASTRAEIRLGSTGYIKGGSNVGDTRILADRFRLYNLAGTQLSYNLASTGEQTWYVGGSEQMRLTSTGLGIGTSSPDQKLVVQGSNVSMKVADGTYSSFVATISSANAYGNGSTVGQLYLRGQAGIGFTGNSGGATQMVLDSSGNLGLGVTPSANSITRAFELQSGFNMFGYANLGYINANAYFNGGWLYKNTAAAGRYEVGDTHKWFTAPSGTAGNAISFTQAMTLDASGNLVIGNTFAQARLSVRTGSAYAANFNTSQTSNTTTGITLGGYESDAPGSNGQVAIRGHHHHAATTASSMSFMTHDGSNLLERARIDSSGNLLVGGAVNTASSKIYLETTDNGLGLRHPNASSGLFRKINVGSDNALYIQNQDNTGVFLSASSTSWGSVSDERMKTTLTPFENPCAKVMALRAGVGRYLSDPDEVSRSFLIAQDVQAVLPEAVSVQADEQGTLGLRYTDTIPLLVAAIQEQQAIIQTLTARVAALESN